MLRPTIRAAVDLLGAPVDSAVLRAAPVSVVMLIFHRAGRRTASPVDVDEHTLWRQLDLLTETGRVRSLDTALDILRDDLAPPTDGPAIVITVDDGTADWPDVFMPALVERGLPATFYVATDFVERRRPLPDGACPVSWAGLAEMLATGLATVGSHTHTHRVLARAGAVETADEVDRSVGLIHDRLGVTPRHFAYPKAIAPSAAAEVVVRRRFASATLAGNRGSAVGSDLHRLGRHALTVADDDQSLRRKTAGGMVLEGWLRERRDAGRVRRAPSS